jgi:diacylglycerol O-acyltransferase
MPLHVAGRRIDSILFASPTSGALALSASAFSYGGQLRVTIAADTAVVPDPWSIVQLFEDELRGTLFALLGGAAKSA